jgi:hypothetical protein
MHLLGLEENHHDGDRCRIMMHLTVRSRWTGQVNAVGQGTGLAIRSQRARLSALGEEEELAIRSQRARLSVLGEEEELAIRSQRARLSVLGEEKELAKRLRWTEQTHEP